MRRPRSAATVASMPVAALLAMAMRLNTSGFNSRASCSIRLRCVVQLRACALWTRLRGRTGRVNDAIGHAPRAFEAAPAVIIGGSFKKLKFQTGAIHGMGAPTSMMIIGANWPIDCGGPEPRRSQPRKSHPEAALLP